MRQDLRDVLQTVMDLDPPFYAEIKGSRAYPSIKGTVFVYPFWDGTLFIAEIMGLPKAPGACSQRFFGFHLHEGTSCTGTAYDPFKNTGEHYNPENCLHPQHAGDFPSLLSSDGYAFLAFYTNKFLPEEVAGKTILVHSKPDDFQSQPSGNAGDKIACGVIMEK